MSDSEKLAAAEAAARQAADERDALRAALAAATQTDDKARADAAEQKVKEMEATAATAKREAVDSVLLSKSGLPDKVQNAARLLMKHDAEDRDAELKRVIAEYGFAPAAPVKRMVRSPGPTTPPANTKAAPSGFMSMQEYLETPREQRLSPEFQKRVEKARKFWPKQIRASSFATDD